MAVKEVTLSEHCGKYSMGVNRDKTEHAEMEPAVCAVEALPGSEIDGSKEVKARRNKAAIALDHMRNLWTQSTGGAASREKSWTK